MNIIEEYTRQQKWRNWTQFLKKLPIRSNDKIIDLGCSVGAVSDLLSKRASSVVGVDLDIEFINYCLSKSKPNQQFICNEFENIDFSSLGPITGVWSSFSLSYLKQPKIFLKSIHEMLTPKGWIALTDVSNFISGNMLPDCNHYNLVRHFENDSSLNGNYDFNFGSKMESLLKEVGFKIIYVDNNVSDEELNFEGPASEDVLANWQSRLIRMQGLRSKFPTIYTEITSEVLMSLKSARRCKNGNVRFVVANKM